MAIIELVHVHKTYDTTAVPVKALSNVSLTIDRGEFTAVVGPSGSGKTTLLNIMGGLDGATEGDVMLDGRKVARLSSAERVLFRLNHIGFVFQAYNLIPVLTAVENVEFIMLLQGVPAADRRAVARELLTSVGLGEKLSNRVAELSGGQQQRVAIARALASKPSFVLADEPTANLDSESASQLLDIMETLNASRATTFVFSTHDQRVVERARRVIRLVDGRVENDSVRT